MKKDLNMLRILRHRTHWRKIKTMKKQSKKQITMKLENYKTFLL